MSKALDSMIKVTKITEKERERQQLMEGKAQNNSFQVAFCGHFSAGKSTILNHLLGAEMLPTSPIPTSANIIGIKNGNLSLTVQSIEGEQTSWDGEIPWQRVREWGMNGAEISSITIQAPLPFLGDNSWIYDTPGVDSTDPTHQAVTLEALYTTDFICYVMDYNHVQSETNLTFLKQLSDEKKPLYLVVNQIDKHDDGELSFQEFDQSIRDTFASWGINILKLRYTSMKARQHPLNQLAQFEREMKAILYRGQELLPFAKQRLQQGFYLSIINRLEEEKEDELDQVKEEMKQQGFSLKQLDRRQTLAISYEQAIHAKKLFEESFEREWQKIVKDVTVFPYTTTELVRSWLESMDPSFKVGLLFTKKKTQEEQEVRLKRLLEETQDKVKSQLEFHLHKLFHSYDFTLLTNREQVETELNQLHVTIDEQFFKEAVQPGPKNREYVYTFTKDRTATIIKILRQKAASIINIMAIGMQDHWEQEQEDVEKELEQLHDIDVFAMQLIKIEDSFDTAIEEHSERVNQYQDAGGFERVLVEAMEKDIPEFKVSASVSSITLPDESVINTDWQQEDVVINDFNQEQANEWIQQLRTVLQQYQVKERFDFERSMLLERIQRFKEQTFTISLFGAFSAGKSSFANALLGDTVLPVSPHPTTATVNIVKRSDKNHASGTAIVQVKSKQQLSDEIKSVGEQLDTEVTIESLVSWKEDPTVTTSWQKTYQSYLLTLKNSLADGKWELGSSFEVKLQELQPFVANEHDACLIDQVTLYYDCPLTEQGIILVDTPGVNSIHGRHTNVAFKQLRDSDAIFYLTYYNHAFSKADQQFLQQMAKVNEGFRTDKLYFILNAADLAHSPYELNGVRKHVYDQLIQNGLNEPRLYPLSSKQGLKGKQQQGDGDELFTIFEKSFYDKTITELKRLSFELLGEELTRYKAMLRKGLEYATGEEKGREEERNKIVAAISIWQKKLDDIKPLTAYQTSTQEVNQLFLFLRDRVRYVLGDQFSEAVNVTTVVGASKRAQQKALISALQEWRSEGEHFIKQEIQATLTRIEIALSNAIEDWMAETIKQIRADFPVFQASYEGDQQDIPLKKTERFITVELEEFKTYFHSAKSFFEEGQLKKLKEVLVEKGTEQSSSALRTIEQQTLALLDEKFENEMKLAKEKLREGLVRELERFEALADPKHVESLAKESNELQAL
ncbi:dynamin family protein [Halalkalibacter alkalisediminis]|uniref:Dynamin family protein n=1 Tax=Halalkalibacter alkalisediminis TaxID=935616 RepID=A0ABV6NGZ2_9BACI|nr:dynamin family protein [Halalkalibacter alkalisediminis]